MRSILVAHSPIIGWLRVEREVVRDPVSVVSENIVAVYTDFVESCRTARDECRDVRRRRQRIRAVKAVKPCGHNREAELSVFRITRSSDEGEVDLFSKVLSVLDSPK